MEQGLLHCSHGVPEEVSLRPRLLGAKFEKKVLPSADILDMMEHTGGNSAILHIFTFECIQCALLLGMCA